MEEPTALLHRWKQGDAEALNLLINQLYPELRGSAVAQLRKHWSNPRLQPTELVNEAYLKIKHLHNIDWHDRVHFLAVVAKVMRQVLTDHYRRENADKRSHQKVTLVTEAVEDGQAGNDNYALGELLDALDELTHVSEDFAELVELKFFGGLTHDEIADFKGVSERTVKRQWRAARAWLQNSLVTAG